MKVVAMCRHATFLIVMCVVAGCSLSAPTVEVSSQEPDIHVSPLSVNTWKMSDEPQKFDLDVLSRLRKDNPELSNAGAWKEFYELTAMPEMNRVVPGSKFALQRWLSVR